MTPSLIAPGRVTAAEGAATLPYPGNEPPAVTAAADRLFDAAQLLDLLRDGLFDARNVLPHAWRGSAATVGAAEVDAIRTALDDGIGRLFQARGALLGAADQLAVVRHDVDVLRSDWCRAEGSVRGADLVLALTVDPVSGALLQEARRDADGRRQLALAGWTAAVARADTVTADCATALLASVSGAPVYRAGRGVVTADLGQALGTDRMVSDDYFRSGLERSADDESAWAALGPSAQLFARAGAGELPSGSPALLAAWWRSRSWTEQQALLHDDPQAVGAADGLPAGARNQANLLFLDRREQAVDDALSAGDPTLAGVVPVAPDPGGLWAEADLDAMVTGVGLAALRSERSNLAAVRTQLAAPRSQPVYLLAVNPAARGLAVVAIGNPDTAEHVATYVPGTGRDISGLGADLERADAWGAGTGEFGTQSVSTIAWLGYVSPPSLPEAAYDVYADDAAPGLLAFQQGLRASHQGRPAQNTVVAHSYGAMVVSAAASGDRSLAADRLVFVAGTGLEIDSVVDLHLDDVPPDDMSKRVFAIRHENDAIQHATLIHDGNPYDADFGGRVIITSAVGPSNDVGGSVNWPAAAGLWTYGEVAAHGLYQEPGSMEQRLISGMIVGVPPR